ncbi:hypothetical protein NSB25_13830 [Acetatifactor muris]|uniref:Uncharacterized protein n=1 Tax=Acetatifactor muris TaxID=879566 RepID=A0A2K4ZI54_9FIRM|nr:hypothetical protein [Acetatifactor muris]MCI8798546.1 hypothetical protein [Lachnospiraceae bacterium]MCR2048369.1 hypothetical protein [Acetatifactor muris]SOY30173.1 hypothetical protein AMURIS_02896 [Acetatifactor muris]
MLANFDKWILTKFSYEVKNTAGNKHKWSYKSDLVFLYIYTGCSLYNAVMMLFPNAALANSPGASPSLLVVILNIIVLVRLNISIYIKKKESINATVNTLLNKGVIKKIDIKAWQSRLGIIYIGYAIDIVISVYYFFYGQAVSESLAVIGIIAIMETFINSFLDNLVARYEAIPEVFMKI